MNAFYIRILFNMFILFLLDELKFLKVIWFVFDELFCGLFI